MSDKLFLLGCIVLASCLSVFAQQRISKFINFLFQFNCPCVLFSSNYMFFKMSILKQIKISSQLNAVVSVLCTLCFHSLRCHNKRSI